MYIALGDISSESFKYCKANMNYQWVNLSIPKWKTETSLNLTDTLKSIGMENAFGAVAYKNMVEDANADITLSDVLHKTYIDVDEKGTEAAAVTAVGIGATCVMPTETVKFKANKPFTYFICDDNTDEIIFMGRYVTPEA